MPVHHSMAGLVGDTPLVELRHVLGNADGPRVFAKLERFNPGGSAKDRPAAAMIAAALADGSLPQGGTIVESSSGNLGVALAQQARWHGMRFVCVVDPRINPSTRRLIQAYGGEVVCVEHPDAATGDWLLARIAMVKQLVARTPDAYWPNQYANRANPRAHAEGTMREIAEELEGDLAAIYVATSTTGTISGCMDYIAAHQLRTRVVAVDAVGSCLFGGQRGPRTLPGFGAGTESELAPYVVPDAVIRVADLDAVKGCRHLVATEAVLAGASGGAVVSALRSDAHRYNAGDNVAIILHDGGEPYLQTVYDDDWVTSQLGCTREELHLPRAVAATVPEAS